MDHCHLRNITNLIGKTPFASNNFVICFLLCLPLNATIYGNWFKLAINYNT